jgi:2'-5' RNA ligase
MLAVTPTDEEAHRIAQPWGEDQAQLHVTLAFLTDDASAMEAGTQQRVAAVAQSVAEKFSGTLRGTVTALTHFGEKDGQVPCIAIVSVNGLDELRVNVIGQLRQEKIAYSSDYGFVPHLTLGYHPPGECPGVDPVVISAPLTFSGVGLWWAGEHQEFSFTPASDGKMPEAPEKEAVLADPAKVALDVKEAVEGGAPLPQSQDEKSLPEKWDAVLAIEGERTTDGRFIEHDALTWRALPLPLMWQKSRAHGGMPQDVCVQVGTIQDIRREGYEIRASGTFDLASEDGRELARRVRDQITRWVSIDAEIQSFDVSREGDCGSAALDLLLAHGETPTPTETPTPPPPGIVTPKSEPIIRQPTARKKCIETYHVQAGSIMGATVVGFPALPGAVIVPAGVDIPPIPEGIRGRPAAQVAAGAFGVEEAHTKLAEARTRVADYIEDPTLITPETMKALLQALSEAHDELDSAIGEKKVEVTENAKAESGEGEHPGGESVAASAVPFGPTGQPVSEQAWDGEASRFTDEQYKESTAACEEGDESVKQRCFLPHHDPNGRVNRRGVYAAAQRLTSLKRSSQAKQRAATHILSHYTRDLNEEPPNILRAASEAEPWALEPAETDEQSAGLLARADQWAADEVAAFVAAAPEGVWRVAPQSELALTACGGPARPPREWFENPQLPELQRWVTVTDDGHVFGHLAGWGECHIGLHRCVTAEKLMEGGFESAMHGHVVAEDGSKVGVMPIAIKNGHADVRWDWRKAQAHYDDPSCAPLLVAVGPDEHGVWFAGTVKPDASPEDILTVRAHGVSGDWRVIGGKLRLVGACAINVPGFPKLQARVASGDVVTLIAAGGAPQSAPGACGCRDDNVREIALRALEATTESRDAYLKLTRQLRPVIREQLLAEVRGG